MFYWCGYCCVSFSSSFNFQRHLQCGKHLDRERAAAIMDKTRALNDAHLEQGSNNVHDRIIASVSDYEKEPQDDMSVDSPDANRDLPDSDGDSFSDYEINSDDSLSDWEPTRDEQEAPTSHKYSLPFSFSAPESEWFPFSSKEELLLAALLSYPDRPSKGFLEFLWGIFFSLGLHNLPSLQKVEKILCELPNHIKTREAITLESNSVFHYIPPSGLIAQLFSVPEVRTAMDLYVNDDESNEILSCLARAEKITDNFYLQTPMINLNGMRIFQHDLVRFQRVDDYDFHLLVRGFIRVNGKMHIRGYRFLINDSFLDVSKYMNISTDNKRQLHSVFRVHFSFP
jgi:hypothetical protein